MKSSLSLKLWGSLLIVFAAIVVVGVVASMNVTRLARSERAVAAVLTVQSKLSNVIALLTDAETGQRGFLITGDEHYLEPYNTASASLGERLNELEHTVSDAETRQAVGTLKKLAAEKMAIVTSVVAVRRTQGFEAAKAMVLTGRGKNTMDQARTLVAGLNDDAINALAERSNEADADAAFTTNIIIGGVTLAALFVALAGAFLNRTIIIPVQALTVAAERISVGDLSVEIKAMARHDEIGALNAAFIRMISSLRQMAHLAQSIASGDLRASLQPHSEQDLLGSAFAVMISNLRQVNSEISEGVGVLAASASEIMVSAGQIATAAAQTATATSQTATTVEEVKQTALVSSQKAGYVADLAQRSAQISVDGRKAVEETIVGMQQVSQHMGQIADSILRLSEQSDAIGEIIATVNDLAEQSNLLAVNASIEAANAGEHGQGFAVVAQEVKSLSEQSRQATAQVRRILGDIQKATGTAVTAIEKGSEAAETGARLSLAAGASIRSLADSSDESADAASQITVSAQQQLAGMGQLAQAADNIRIAAVQNMEGTRQTEIAAHNLHALGERLRLVVARFQV